MPDPDIAINPASEITAAQWVDMIKRSQYVPQYVTEGIKAKNNAIVGPAKIRQPAKTIPREWPSDLAAAFASRHLEITTAQENFEVIKDGTEYRAKRRIFLNLQKGEFGPGYWFQTGPNQREWSPDTFSLATSFKLGEIGLSFGETFSSEEVNKHAKVGERSSVTRLKSQRALIMIVNRVAVTGFPPGNFFSLLFPGFSDIAVASRQFQVPEHKLVSVFLHELAPHAGRMSQGKGAMHGDLTVELSVKEIEELFPEDTTLNKVTTALAEAKGHLIDESLRGSTKGRPPARDALPAP